MEQSAFYSLNGNEQVTLAAVVAILLSEGLNQNQLNILGNFLEGIGQNILLIQAVTSSQPNTEPGLSELPEPDTEHILIQLKKEVELLKARVAELEAR